MRWRLPHYLSIAEGAALYQVSRDYLRDRIIDGSLPAVRSGRKIIRVLPLTWSACSGPSSRYGQSTPEP